MTTFPHRETIEFEHTSTVSTDERVRGNDFDNVDGDFTLSSKEVFEVESIELLPPRNADDSLQTFESIRLYDGENFYPYLRYREFMLGWSGATEEVSTPRLGQPVLENIADPADRPFLTACPKFGPEDQVSIALQNDSTADITDDFTVRVTGWRFKGTGQELREYFNGASNLSSTIPTTVSMSNPFDGEGDTFGRETVNISPNADGGAHGQFAKLPGGVDQSLPEIYPWVTWADNESATRANTPYEFDFAQDNVLDKWQSLYWTFDEGEDAVMFDYVMANEDVTNLDQLSIELESRDSEDIPQFDVQPTDQHELPFVRFEDGSSPITSQTEVPIGGSINRPVTAVDGIPRRVSNVLQPAETMVWNDEGGIVIEDDGTSVPANEILIGIQGRRMELEG